MQEHPKTIRARPRIPIPPAIFKFRLPVRIVTRSVSGGQIVENLDAYPDLPRVDASQGGYPYSIFAIFG